MKSTLTIRTLVLTASVLALTAGSAFAQQIIGTPGSPSATMTPDGRYLPNPQLVWRQIGLSAQVSSPTGNRRSFRQKARRMFC